MLLGSITNYPWYRQLSFIFLLCYTAFNIIYIMRRHGIYGPVAFLGVSTSYSPQPPTASMVGLAVASIEGCRLVPTDLQPVSPPNDFFGLSSLYSHRHVSIKARA